MKKISMLKEGNVRKEGRKEKQRQQNEEVKHGTRLGRRKVARRAEERAHEIGRCGAFGDSRLPPEVALGLESGREYGVDGTADSTKTVFVRRPDVDGDGGRDVELALLVDHDEEPLFRVRQDAVDEAAAACGRPDLAQGAHLGDELRQSRRDVNHSLGLDGDEVHRLQGFGTGTRAAGREHAIVIEHDGVVDVTAKNVGRPRFVFAGRLDE
mmetsp:Transcript_32145/g.102503  ORF Transcript_32145/g.102503 Transcript_32145/m.102503 type:complete len:211 (-) Transcript_32145:644-1276(-)